MKSIRHMIQRWRRISVRQSLWRLQVIRSLWLVFQHGRTVMKAIFCVGQGGSVSEGFALLTHKDVIEQLRSGWKDVSIPLRQRQVVERELAEMYAGRVRPVFQVVADSFEVVGLENPSVLEVGCASGYYQEVLSFLLGHRINYVGIDYSQSLVKLAKEKYNSTPFVVSDAKALPFADESFDVVLSGCVLMHADHYEEVIRESQRVASKWVIFHRTPIVETHETLVYKKRAYGVPVLEIVFNEAELMELFRKYGLDLMETFLVERGRLPLTPDEVVVKTYVCRC